MYLAIPQDILKVLMPETHTRLSYSHRHLQEKYGQLESRNATRINKPTSLEAPLPMRATLKGSVHLSKISVEKDRALSESTEEHIKSSQTEIEEEIAQEVFAFKPQDKSASSRSLQPKQI